LENFLKIRPILDGWLNYKLSKMDKPKETFNTRKIHLIHQLKSFLVDHKPFGFGRMLKLINALFFDSIPSGEILIKTLDKFWIYINPNLDKGIETKLYLTGTYEKGLLDILNQILGPGQIVIDAGANIGLISIFCSLKVGNRGMVFAFEPHPDTYLILEKNVRINSCKNVKMIQKALGSESISSKIYSNFQINRGASSIVVHQEDSPSFDINVVPLDDFLDKNIEIDLFKIDVEGFEMEVLRGAIKILQNPDPPVLIVECSDSRDNFKYNTHDLYEFITSVNHYSIFRFKNGKERISKLEIVNSTEELPSHDNIICIPKSKMIRFPQNLFC
jgi:FkbM family methyltransferase